MISRRAAVWCTLLCVVGVRVGSGQGDPCPSFSCKNEADPECWRRVGTHTDVGQTLAAAGHISAALMCFTRAANGVQDERWLPMQHSLSADRRLALSRLYTTAASAMIAAGQQGDELHAWLRRAVQISAPSAQVLFEEDEPPDPPPEASSASSRIDPSKQQEDSSAHELHRTSACSPGQAEQLIAEGRWEEGGRCLRQTIEQAFEGAGALEPGMDQLAGVFFQVGAAAFMASEQKDSGAKQRESASASDDNAKRKQQTEAARSMLAAMRMDDRGRRSEEGGEAELKRKWRSAYTWPMTLGDVLMKTRKEGQAVQCYAKALRASPLDPKVLLRLTRAASIEAYRLRDADGDAVAALQLLRTVVVMLPRSGFDGAGRVHSDICSLCRLTKKLPLAIEHCGLALHILEHLSSRTQHSDPERSTLDRLLADAHFNKGVVLYDMKRYAEAAAELRHSAVLRPDALDCRLYLGYAVMNRALQQRWAMIEQGMGMAAPDAAEKDMIEALEVLLEAQALDPTEPNTYVSLAQTLMGLGMSDAGTDLLKPIAQDAANGARDPFYQHLHVDSAVAEQVIRQLRSALDRGDVRWRIPVAQPCTGGRLGSVQRSAVAYLTSDSSSDLTDLAMSLGLLRSHFFDVHGMYSVIVFHDSLQEHHMSFLQSAFGAGCPLSFQRISLEASAPISTDTHFRYFHQAPHQGVGYRSMCRYFSGPIFEHEAMRGLDYYMRLDTDSFFLHPLPEDPFKRVRDQGAVYAYLTTATEEGSMCIGLEEEMTTAVDRLARHAMTQPRRKAEQWDRTFFYNNFEVTAVQFWRSDAYREVFQALDASGGFFSQRWGDGPVRSIALRLMAEPSKVMKLARISYWHQTFVTLPRQ